MGELALHPPSLIFARLACRVGFKLYFAACPVTGTEHLPEGRPYILALNHPSRFDAGLLWSYFPDAIYFLRPASQGGVARWLTRELEQVPLEGAPKDSEAWELARRYLKEMGRCLGIFADLDIEGGGLDLAALLARETEAPIVPAFIHGMREALPRGAIIPSYTREISIRIGPAVDRPGQGSLREEAERVRAALRTLGGLSDSEGPR